MAGTVHIHSLRQRRLVGLAEAAQIVAVYPVAQLHDARCQHGFGIEHLLQRLDGEVGHVAMRAHRESHDQATTQGYHHANTRMHVGGKPVGHGVGQRVFGDTGDGDICVQSFCHRPGRLSRIRIDAHRAHRSCKIRVCPLTWM